MANARSKLAGVDLNLLVVFDAVMQDRSVTRAGNRLGLSQSAMSHALSRLRHMLKDELFVRTPSGMAPTPRAEQLVLPVRQALEGLQHSLEPIEFDPATAVMRFRVAADNYAAVIVVGPLAPQLIKTAPGVSMDFRASGTLNLPALLDASEIDLAIGVVGDLGERFSRQALVHDEFIAVLRRDHPAAESLELTLDSFANLPHLEISSVRHDTSFIDTLLHQHGLRRRIALRAPFICAAQILGASDMVAVFPRRFAEEMVRNRSLVIRQLLPSPPTIELAMVWARRLDNQPALRWLRSGVELIAGGLAADRRQVPQG